MEQQWYFRSGKEVLGPVSAAKLKSMARAGTLRPYVHIRLGKSGDWVSADTIKGLAFGDEIGEEEGEEEAADETAGGGTRRYPMLHTYLDMSANVLAIGTAIGALALVAFLIAGIVRASQVTQGAGYVVVTDVAFVVLGAVVLAVWYIAGIAGIEFVRVVIDVEANTREIAGRLKTVDGVKG